MGVSSSKEPYFSPDALVRDLDAGEWQQFYACVKSARKAVKKPLRTRNGDTGVHILASRGCVEGLKAVLDAVLDAYTAEKGAPLTRHEWARCSSKLANLLNDRGRTPLMAASKAGSVDCVKLLLEYQANVWIRDRSGGAHALHYATSAGQEEVIPVLLEHACAHPNPNNPTTSLLELGTASGLTPLHYAVWHKRHKVVGQLCELGASLYATSTWTTGGDSVPCVSGSTPLHVAAVCGSARCTKALMKAYAVQLGAHEDAARAAGQVPAPLLDPRLMQDRQGNLPFAVALQHNHTRILSYLHPFTPLAEMFVDERPDERVVGVPRLLELAAMAAQHVLLGELCHIEETAATTITASPPRVRSSCGVHAPALDVALAAAAPSAATPIPTGNGRNSSPPLPLSPGDPGYHGASLGASLGEPSRGTGGTSLAAAGVACTCAVAATAQDSSPFSNGPASSVGGIAAGLARSGSHRGRASSDSQDSARRAAGGLGARQGASASGQAPSRLAAESPLRGTPTGQRPPRAPGDSPFKSPPPVPANAGPDQGYPEAAHPPGVSKPSALPLPHGLSSSEPNLAALDLPYNLPGFGGAAPSWVERRGAWRARLPPLPRPSTLQVTSDGAGGLTVVNGPTPVIRPSANQRSPEVASSAASAAMASRWIARRSAWRSTLMRHKQQLLQEAGSSVPVPLDLSTQAVLSSTQSLANLKDLAAKSLQHINRTSTSGETPSGRTAGDLAAAAQQLPVPLAAAVSLRLLGLGSSMSGPLPRRTGRTPSQARMVPMPEEEDLADHGPDDDLPPAAESQPSHTQIAAAIHMVRIHRLTNGVQDDTARAFDDHIPEGDESQCHTPGSMGRDGAAFMDNADVMQHVQQLLQRSASNTSANGMVITREITRTPSAHSMHGATAVLRSSYTGAATRPWQDSAAPTPPNGSEQGFLSTREGPTGASATAMAAAAGGTATRALFPAAPGSATGGTGLPEAGAGSTAGSQGPNGGLSTTGLILGSAAGVEASVPAISTSAILLRSASRTYSMAGREGGAVGSVNDGANSTGSGAPCATSSSAHLLTRLLTRMRSAAMSEAGEESCGVCLESGTFVDLKGCSHRICVSCAKELVRLHDLKPALCPFCRRIIMGFTMGHPISVK